MNKKAISLKNWSDWCQMHTFELANADDKELWNKYSEYAREIVEETVVVPDGEETHHLRVDLEHMRPYIEEGGYNA